MYVTVNGTITEYGLITPPYLSGASYRDTIESLGTEASLDGQHRLHIRNE